ncbi:MAG: hypothetical protein WA102_01965 [Candidatus Methanoperedens sp.]
MFDLKNKINEVKNFILATLIFIVLAFFISFPLFYIFSLYKDGMILFMLFSYFVTIMALSISYYYFYKETWKDNITLKIIVISIIIYHIFIYTIFGYINTLMNINIVNVPSPAVIGLMFSFSLLFLDYYLLHFFVFTRWIFRSFKGKGVTLENKFDDPKDFDNLIKLISGTIHGTDDSVIIDDGFQTCFLNYNKENGMVVFQIAKQNGFNFFVNKRVKNFEHLLESLGFNNVGEKNINHAFFISKHDYPKFARSNKIALLWAAFGISSIILNKMPAKENFFLFTKMTEIFSLINGILKENPVIVFILGVAVTVLISHFQQIKSAFKNLHDSLEDV